MDEAVCCVALGSDNRTAFVIVTFMDEAFFWNDFSSRWALVDLERGRVLDEGDLGFKALSVDISPDGEHAAASGSVGEVGVVDLDSGEQVRPPVKGHEDGIYFFRYSPDGSRIVTGGADDAVALWDGPTGEAPRQGEAARPSRAPVLRGRVHARRAQCLHHPLVGRTSLGVGHPDRTCDCVRLPRGGA